MKLSFISSRSRQGQEDREETMPGTVQISVPCELVMSILARGATLQVQIGPVPIRPVLRPASSPERPEPAPLRPNPSGGSDADPPRPERPPSRHPAARNARTVRPMRAVSPFTDWSSLPENNDVISISSSDGEDNYVPRSPEYIPNSPEPETETEDQNPGQNGGESSPTRRTDQVNNNDNEDRPRSPLGRGNFLQRVSPFLRGLGHPRRQLGRIRPM